MDKLSTVHELIAERLKGVEDLFPAEIGYCNADVFFDEQRALTPDPSTYENFARLHIPETKSRPPDLKAANLSFSARVVIAVRDRFQGDAPRVYTAARLTRAAYSRFISDETAQVSKDTAMRMALALRLDHEEAKRLLASAGYAFSMSKALDVVVLSCIEMLIYNMDVINALLVEYQVDFQF